MVKIVGVVHTPEHLDGVVERLPSLFSSGQRVGLEPSPEDLMFYDQFIDNKCKYQRDKIRIELGLGNDYNFHELEGIYLFHEFFFEIYKKLLEMDIPSIGVGSRLKDLTAFDMIKKSIDSSEGFSDSRKDHSMLISPHFDYHVSEKVKKDNLDGVVIGVNHRKISELLKCEFVDLSGRSEFFSRLPYLNVDKLHKDYESYDKSRLPVL
jgi:hypothetical protein